MSAPHRTWVLQGVSAAHWLCEAPLPRTAFNTRHTTSNAVQSYPKRSLRSDSVSREVTSLLEKLRAEIEQDGKDEAAAYDKSPDDREANRGSVQ